MLDKGRRKADNELDDLTDAAAQAIDTAVQDLPEADAPYDAVKLSRAEQIDRYLEMRDDEAAWTEMLSKYGLNETLNYYMEMEGKKVQKGARENGDSS